MQILNCTSRLKGGLAVILFLTTTCLSGISCGNTNASAPSIPMTTVMQAVRDYGRGHQSTALSLTKAPAAQNSVNDRSDLDGTYQAHIGLVFAQGDFAQVEKIANQARSDKSRLSGGVWKLFALYDGLAKPPAGNRASDADWSAHIDDLKKWIAAYPESATARIALAQA